MIGFDDWAVSQSESSDKDGEPLFTFKPDEASIVLRSEESSQNDKPLRRVKSAPKPVTELRRRYPGPGHYDQTKGRDIVNGPNLHWSFGRCPPRKDLPYESTWTKKSLARKS